MRQNEQTKGATLALVSVESTPQRSNAPAPVFEVIDCGGWRTLLEAPNYEINLETDAVRRRAGVIDRKGNVIEAPGAPLTPCHKRGGYVSVQLVIGDKQRARTLHRLKWQAHRGPIPPGYVINHIDGNPQNNALENLECVTQQENARHARQVLQRGRVVPDDLKALICELHSCLPGVFNSDTLAKHFGISNAAVSRTLRAGGVPVIVRRVPDRVPLQEKLELIELLRENIAAAGGVQTVKQRIQVSTQRRPHVMRKLADAGASFTPEQIAEAEQAAEAERAAELQAIEAEREAAIEAEREAFEQQQIRQALHRAQAQVAEAERRVVAAERRAHAAEQRVASAAARLAALECGAPAPTPARGAVDVEALARMHADFEAAVQGKGARNPALETHGRAKARKALARARAPGISWDALAREKERARLEADARLVAALSPQK